MFSRLKHIFVRRVFLTHKIGAIGAVGVLGVVAVGAIFLAGTAKQDGFRQTAERAEASAALTNDI